MLWLIAFKDVSPWSCLKHQQPARQLIFRQLKFARSSSFCNPCILSPFYSNFAFLLLVALDDPLFFCRRRKPRCQKNCHPEYYSTPSGRQEGGISSREWLDQVVRLLAGRAEKLKIRGWRRNWGIGRMKKKMWFLSAQQTTILSRCGLEPGLCSKCTSELGPPHFPGG